MRTDRTAGQQISRQAFARIGAVAVCAALSLGATALPAAANEDDVRRSASCGSGEIKIKLSPEDGRIETEVEVDTNRGGQQWVVRIFHDGTRAAKVTGVTGGRSGSFEVRRVLTNHRGQDAFAGTARRNGTVCSVRATF
jgi:hypothetical protein